MAKSAATTVEHSIDFYAHHSPFGANSSFTLGRWGKGGGFGLELSRPADQSIFLAYSRKGEQPCAIPFFQGEFGSLEAFAVAGPQDQPPFHHGWHVFSREEIRRDMGWASDTWQAGELTFRIVTPFGEVADPETADPQATRLAILPAMLAEIEFDNSRSKKPAWVFLGLGDPPAMGMYTLGQDTGGKLLGIARGGRWGLAALPDGKNVRESQEWFLNELMDSGAPKLHGLPFQGGLVFRAAAGKKCTFTAALGVYLDGTATAGLATRYYYARHYAGLTDVLSTALANADALKAQAAARDRELRASGLNRSRQFLLAHATHSYYGSSQLLEAGGKPVWVVNEGEYQMMNTFDLTVDHLFFELRFHPWAVRNALDQFADRYSYYDQTQDVAHGRAAHPGGISFTHDMGVGNHFSPPGRSSYEIPDRDICFSNMTAEQLVNWVLCAATYGITQDDRDWLTRRQATFRDTLTSMLNRDHHDPAKRIGLTRYDSSRCGATGQEITTYDSLDASLGQARNNLYLAVKTWAAYVALEKVFALLGGKALAKQSAAMAKLSARTIAGRMDRKAGFIPAVFEKNNTSRIIPAVEGLVFPHVLGDADAVSPTGRFGPLIRALKQHTKTVLVRGVCIDLESGGWKMSSTSQNTWMSKIALCQYVIREVLGLRFGQAEAGWDRAHAHWQQVGCADWAFTDQIRSTDGKDLGSRYYPRGVTSILWLR